MWHQKKTYCDKYAGAIEEDKRLRNKGITTGVQDAHENNVHCRLSNNRRDKPPYYSVRL